MQELPGDGPCTRKTVADMSEQELVEFLEGVRFRRMQMHDSWRAEQTIKAAAACAKLQKQLDAQAVMVAKELARFDKAAETVENRLNKIRAIRAKIETLEGTENT